MIYVGKNVNAMTWKKLIYVYLILKKGIEIKGEKIIETSSRWS